MGLGKTLQALSIAYYYKNEWPLLIVCPSSMRFPWIEEIEKWLPDVQPQELNLVQSGVDTSNLKCSKISVVGYGLLSHSSSRLLINCLKDTKFGVIIVDESHYMKNRKAARTKALVSVIKKAKRAILLTGTPALARPEELYTQIDVLKPNLLGSFSRFANRYCEAHNEYVCGGRVRKWNTQGASNLDELHNVLKSNVMIRRLKRHVLTQLPPKRRQRITFDLAESESKKQLAGSIEEFRDICKQIKKTKPSSPSQIPAETTNALFEMKRLATILYKQTGISKITAVRQYIADILENSDKKFLVFAHHVDVMKAIEREVVKKKVKYIRIAGDVPSVLRGSLVHQFQTDANTRVAILSILAASVGITLTAADHIVFSELHWTPGVMEQAEDRCHRIGQENHVLVQYLVAKGTIDEVLWRMLSHKVYVTTATLNGELQGLDVEEGSEVQSKLLAAFSAWVMEDEDEEILENDVLFTRSQKKRKQDSLQRSLRDFFQSPSTTKCRKTDSSQEWTEILDSSSGEEESCKTAELDMKMQSRAEAEVTVSVDSSVEENSSLFKTTKKTYKLCKKKSPETKRETSAVPSSESQEFGLELAREIVQITADDTREPANSDEVNILSSYTRLLSKQNSNLPGVYKTNDENGVDESLAECKDGLNVGESNSGMSKFKDITPTVGPNENKVFPDKLSHGKESNETTVNKHIFPSDHVFDEKESGVLELNSIGRTPVEEQCCLSHEAKKINKVLVKKEDSGQEQSLQGNDACVSQEQALSSARREDINQLLYDETMKDIDGRPALRCASSGNVSSVNDSSQSRTQAVEASVASSDEPELCIPDSVENMQDFKTWCCSVCTFRNNAFLRMCEICETPRYRSRRRSANANWSTDEFVKRKQKKILAKCSDGRDGKCRTKSGKRQKKQKGLEAVESDAKGLVGVTVDVEESTRDVRLPSVITDDCSSIEAKLGDTKDLKAISRVNERHSCTLISVDDCSALKANSSENMSKRSDVEAKSSDSIPERSEVEVEQQVAPKGKQISAEQILPESTPEILVKPVDPDYMSDEDFFAVPPPLSEEARDEMTSSEQGDNLVTSSCETDTATDNRIEPGSEFDDITDDDWWVCPACKTYNYDEAADQCESCGLMKSDEDLEGLVTDLDADDCWKCEDCGEFNFGDDIIRRCPKCRHGDERNRKSLAEQYEKLRHLIVDDEGSENDIVKPEIVENLMFRLSSYTDRVYLYDRNGGPLNCSVNIADLDDSNTENTCSILSEVSNKKRVMRFARKWKSLEQRKRRMIRKAGIIFEDPYEAVETVRTGRGQKISTSRFPSKEKLVAEVLETAQVKNGAVRHCVKPKGKNMGKLSAVSSGTVEMVGEVTRWIQAMDKDGRPLCLSCKEAVDTKNTMNCLWDERFCSHKCKEQYQCRISGTRVRAQLFEDEKGVCQKCGCNAHELYRKIKLLSKPDRRSFLENTPFISLPITLLNRIIMDPKEGMFWEADHVVAVVEGGGECDLENYRTLCVPCHRDVTAELRERLRMSRRKHRLAGIPDITSFFNS